jgi:hypothetical protein
MTLSARPHPTWGRPTARLLVMTCLILPAVGASAEAAPTRYVHAAHGRTMHYRSNHARATAARAFPNVLRVAARRARRADRALVFDARGLKACFRDNPKHPRRCNAARQAVQRAGTRLARAERRLARIARTSSATGARHGGSARANLRQAPQLTVAGFTLHWTRVARINTYVLLSNVPGRAVRYSVVSGTSVTPPPVPGVTVRYSVRTTANGSAWSAEQAISYPSPPTTLDTQAAPALSVSGQTLSWSTVANVNTYVLRRSVSGQVDRFSVVSGTSVTPAPVSGTTVRYSVRTAVEGSAWSSQVAIVYPAAAPPASRTLPEPASAGFQPGVTSGSDQLYDIPGAAKLGAKVVRLAFPINESVRSIEPVIAEYAAKGIRVAPMADFDSYFPTPAETTGLALWAKAFGPGGTFWAGRSNSGLAITSIEFGNETSYSYQYPDDSPSGYAARAQSYALRFAEAATAVRAANPGVGLLAQGDSGNAGPAWVQDMFKAVPDLGGLVAGWTIHPYGPEWHERLVNLVNQTAAQGAPATIPIDITEWGISSDNGRCLSANFGWNKCMTYQEAGDALTRSVSEMRQLLGGRLGHFTLYQVRDQKLTGSSSDIEAYFGALQHELQPKGAFTQAVEALMAQ